MTSNTPLRGLGDRLPGKVSLPGDPRYAAATAIWARPTGRMPCAVVHCRSALDVQTAIRAARDRDLPLSVRGGGHDWAGRALCGGIVLDLRGMDRVTMVREDEIEISGGARAAHVAAVADRHGAAAVTGSVGAVGMTGLTLGGGYGPLIGRFGLAADNLLSAEVVLADGRIVRADPANDDLYWALRGGGGNFGVVTFMRHRLHPLPSVRGGLLFYPFAEARAVLERCAEVAAVMPDEMSVQVGLGAGPGGVPVVLVAPTWCGRPEDGEARVAPFLRLGTGPGGSTEAMPYGRLLTLFDPLIVDGRRVHIETCWLPALAAAAIDLLAGAMEDAPSPGCAIFTHEFKGAASSVRRDATAFGLRRDHVLIEVLALFDDDAEGDRHRAWARATRDALASRALPGGYANLLAPWDIGRAARSYGPNASRLAAVKRRFDPDDVFSSAIPLPQPQRAPVALDRRMA